MFFRHILAFWGLCTVTTTGNNFNSTIRAENLFIRTSSSSTCTLEDPFLTFSASQHYHDLTPASAKPWTTQPTCSSNNTTPLCIFTDSDFSSGRGISILTKPTTAVTISRLPAFSSPDANLSVDSINSPHPPPFEVVELPGRGIGLVANRTIHRGELIMVNTAIAIFHNKAVNKKSPDFDTNIQLLKSTIDKLPAKSQQLFMSQVAHNPNNNPYLERIFTNAFGVYFGGEEHMVAFPETARMNHDCRPNAMYYVDYKGFAHYTHASRTIYAGEEITDTYVDPLQTHSKRRAAVKAWGFDCTCSLCTQLPEFIEESDRRITHIKELTAFMKGDTSGNERDRRVIRGTPEMAEFLVSLYEQERLYASIVDGYRLAALSYSAAGIELLAVKWAMLAVEAGLIHFGPRDRDLVDMRSLLDDPRAHWSWNFKAREGN